MGFPKGFLWGTSISAEQAEGGWNEGGKSPVMLDFAAAAASHTEPRRMYYLNAKGAMVTGTVTIGQNVESIGDGALDSLFSENISVDVQNHHFKSIEERRAVTTALFCAWKNSCRAAVCLIMVM